MTLVDYISNDLRTKILGGRYQGHVLTLEQLSRQYDVSVTPIRQAIAQLIQQGFLTRDHKRRLSVCGQLGICDVEAPSISIRPLHVVDIAERIGGDLVRLSLEGNAVFLREEPTAEKYGISRSSLRQVFQRLAGGGLLEQLPRRGWRLRPFRQQDLDQFFEFRELLEVKALDCAIPHLEEAVLKGMLEANTQSQSKHESLRLDESLHTYFVAMSGNSYLQDSYERMRHSFDAIGMFSRFDNELVTKSANQHREIILALLDGDYKTAQSTLSNHILHQHLNIERLKEISNLLATEDEEC